MTWASVPSVAAVGAGEEGEDVVDLVGVVGHLGAGAAGACGPGAGTGATAGGGPSGTAAGSSRPSGVHRFPPAALPRGAPPRLGGAAGGAPGGGSRKPERPRPEVDAARVERVEEAELLDDRQRGVVAHQHGARADPDALGRRRHQADDQRRSGAGHARVEVVLGHPVAAVAGGLGAPGEVDGVGAAPGPASSRWARARGRARRGVVGSCAGAPVGLDGRARRGGGRREAEVAAQGAAPCSRGAASRAPAAAGRPGRRSRRGRWG